MVWKKIAGLQDYSVSTEGHVRNDITGELVPEIGTTYKMVRIGPKNGKRALHRLVAKTFIPNPDNLPIVHHIDENKHNNSVDNLMWCTVQYNNSANDLGNRRIREGGAGRKMRKCEVDGLIFDCIADAERHFNIRENCLCVYLRQGYTEYKGHKIKYLN